nr:meiosis 1 arrest protein isoform X1 [Camelus dromedarius]
MEGGKCVLTGLSLQYVYTCVRAFVCVHLFLFCKEEKAASAAAKNRKGFKMRLRCKGGNSSEGRFLLLLFHIGSGFWISSARLPRLRMGWGVLWAGRTGTRSSLLGCWLTGREDRAWDCAVGLAAAGMQREVGTSSYGSLGVSLQGQWFLAQDVVAGKPDGSGTLCSRVLQLRSPRRPRTPCTCSADSVLDDLELEPTYNPLQVWSHLYPHLSSTFAKPQGQLHPSWESRGLRKHPCKAGQLQINRVRARVAPLPMTPAPGRAPKMPAASKASSGVFFPPSTEEEEEMEEEECPSGP